MTRTIDRRALLGALAGLPLAACVAESSKPATRVARFREVRVDAGSFAAKGVTNYAAKVADRLRIAVAGAFAGRIAPGDAGAPVLVIEVAQVQMAAFVGGASHGTFDNSAGDNDDTMIGALVLLSGKGAVIERRRHFASTDAASSGDWRLPDNEDRRLDALCRLYAAWAAREFD
ncbi:MAG: hypothetical protein OEL76_12625 [Siculibacillus sp.]|nr:hypothetical protein [Siculibacillus sp.]